MIELNQKQKEELKKVAEKYGLKFVIVHGSYATGKEKSGSDLDIAVLGKFRKEGVPLDKLLKIHNELGDIFGDGPERELDLKSLHNVDSLFRYFVIRDGALLYGNEADYEEFKLYAFRDFYESQDLRNLEMTMTRKKQGMLTQRYAE